MSVLRGVCVSILFGLTLFSSVAAQTAEEAINVANSLSLAFESVAEKATPALVNISTTAKAMQVNEIPLDPFKDFFGDEFVEKFFHDFNNGKNGGTKKKQKKPQGMGTGFLIDNNGHILTNNHVISGGDEVEVRFSDNRKFKAKVVGADPRTDLAVIKIEAQDLKPLILGDSDKLKIGEWVIAAGSPFGLSNSVTAGIVSAKGRSIMGGTQYEDFIQTDAAINPGNSGGPLLNLRGEVVGVNTAIYSRSGGYMGIGFAIPSKMVSRIMQSLIKSGKVSRGWLGIIIQPLTEELKEQFSFTGKSGILIGDVSAGKPAEKAGLKAGDIIVKFDGTKIDDVNQFRNLVADHAPDSTIDIVLFREGKMQTLPVKLGELQDEQPVQEKAEPEVDDLGLSLQDLTAEMQSGLGLKTSGKVLVRSVEPYSLASEAGVQTNDVILKVAGKDVKSSEHFYDLIKSSNLKKGVLLIVETSSMRRFVLLKKD